MAGQLAWGPSACKKEDGGCRAWRADQNWLLQKAFPVIRMNQPLQVWGFETFPEIEPVGRLMLWCLICKSLRVMPWALFILDGCGHQLCLHLLCLLHTGWVEVLLTSGFLSWKGTSVGSAKMNIMMPRLRSSVKHATPLGLTWYFMPVLSCWVRPCWSLTGCLERSRLH